ncbi:hypothetical protein CEXT_131 [Caerostris extrusa]|uniref:Uncharacterized protein n=1 Tax=Caerostris extrusa TaxID=172846 RepID=A0AAV4WL80_CAEEX|nr:hypothetical protein CEXT_131 [Caerostris extrusa]
MATGNLPFELCCCSLSFDNRLRLYCCVGRLRMPVVSEKKNPQQQQKKRCLRFYAFEFFAATQAALVRGRNPHKGRGWEPRASRADPINGYSMESKRQKEVWICQRSESPKAASSTKKKFCTNLPKIEIRVLGRW